MLVIGLGTLAVVALALLGPVGRRADQHVPESPTAMVSTALGLTRQEFEQRHTARSSLDAHGGSYLVDRRDVGVLFGPASPAAGEHQIVRHVDMYLHDGCVSIDRAREIGIDLTPTDRVFVRTTTASVRGETHVRDEYVSDFLAERLAAIHSWPSSYIRPERPGTYSVTFRFGQSDRTCQILIETYK
jgi:hypothetical protein